MKSIRVTTQPDGTLQILPLPLPIENREGTLDPEIYRRQARGEAPIDNVAPQQSRSLRAITLSDGKFDGLAIQPGALLNFVISGNVTLSAGLSEGCNLESGDVFLTDAASSSAVAIYARNEARLLQIDVTDSWPGSDATPQEPGSIMPRETAKPNLKRMYTGSDDKSYFNDFWEIFDGPIDQWTPPRRIRGFRILLWGPGGKIDYHPGVTVQIGLMMSGAMELQVSGDGSAETFYAGDMCLAEDKFGMGHRNKKFGTSHTAHIVMEEDDLWPYEKAH